MNIWQKFIKRLFDFFFSLTVLVLSFPLLIIMGILIKIESKGSVFFKQERIGKDGKPFILYKLRTMIDDAVLKGRGIEVIEDDDRITKLGRFLRKYSIDEIPQCLNIIKGEMSVIGPRPTLSYQVEKYNERQRRRLEVKPGITGLAQVRGRNEIPWSKRIEYDIEYIDNYTLLLDIQIFFQSVFLVLSAKKVYSVNGNVFDLEDNKKG